MWLATLTTTLQRVKSFRFKYQERLKYKLKRKKFSLDQDSNPVLQLYELALYQLSHIDELLSPCQYVNVPILLIFQKENLNLNWELNSEHFETRASAQTIKLLRFEYQDRLKSNLKTKIYFTIIPHITSSLPYLSILLGAIHKLRHMNFMIFLRLPRPCHRWSYF